MYVAGVAYGRHIAGAVPCGADAIGFAEYGQLARGSQAADLADVYAHEVYQPLAYKAHPLHRVVEELSHGQRHCGLRADLAEPVHLFRGQRVFEEEEAVGLHGLGQAHRLNGYQTFMHIMAELHLEAQLAA